MTHSPGPWSIRKHDGYIPEDYCEEPVEIIATNGDVIANNETYYPCGLDPKNARLIAASPELLEALETLYQVTLGGTDFDVTAACSRAAEVIIKAGGNCDPDRHLA